MKGENSLYGGVNCKTRSHTAITYNAGSHKVALCLSIREDRIYLQKVHGSTRPCYLSSLAAGAAKRKRPNYAAFAA